MSAEKKNEIYAKVHKVEVFVSDDLKRDLETFAQIDDTTPSEIFRRAMALYALARGLRKDGGYVILKSITGDERHIVDF